MQKAHIFRILTAVTALSDSALLMFPEDGEYVLTVVFVKSANKRKNIWNYRERQVKLSYGISGDKGLDAWRTYSDVISLNKGDNTIERNPIGSPMDSAATQYKKYGKRA